MFDNTNIINITLILIVITFAQLRNLIVYIEIEQVVHQQKIKYVLQMWMIYIYNYRGYIMGGFVYDFYT